GSGAPPARVLAHPPREHLIFPCPRRHLEPRQLIQDCCHAARAIQSELLIQMLPAREELKELRGRHRLDLAAERLDRVSADARQQPALAPRRSSMQSRPQDRAVVLELEQQRILVVEDWPKRLESAEQDLLRVGWPIDG